MKKRFVGGLLVAGLVAGCGGEQAPEKVEQLELTAERETYPYDPAEAGPKGSGDLGQTEKPLKMGERVVAQCIDRPDSDKEGLADAVRLASGEFEDHLVPLQVYPAKNGKIAEDPVAVFHLSPDEIRAKLRLC